MLVKLKDLPEVSPNKFQPDNSVLSLHVGTPCYRDLATGRIHVEEDFTLIGWCRNMHPRFMTNREGQIGLLLFCEDVGECWQHYPLFDLDDYEAAIFSTKRQPLTESETP